MFCRKTGGLPLHSVFRLPSVRNYPLSLSFYPLIVPAKERNVNNLRCISSMKRSYRLRSSRTWRASKRYWPERCTHNSACPTQLTCGRLPHRRLARSGMDKARPSRKRGGKVDGTGAIMSAWHFRLCMVYFYVSRE